MSKNTGGRLGKIHLALRKGLRVGQKTPEADWAPYTWLLKKRGSLFGPKTPPEADPPTYTWLLWEKGPEKRCGGLSKQA